MKSAAVGLREWCLPRPSALTRHWRRCVTSGATDSTVTTAVGFTTAADALAAHGVDVECVRRRNPHALRYGPARILATISALRTTDVDPAKALSRWPKLLASDPRSWEARRAALREMNLDASKVVTAWPAVLSKPPDTLRAKCAVLSHMGLDASKVVRHCPSVFGYRKDRILATVAFLEAAGLESVRVVNGCPPVLCYRVETKLRPIVEFVTGEMGRDVRELQTNPACFNFSLENRLRPRYAFALLHGKGHLGLSTLFFRSDRRFADIMEQPLDQYRAWLSQSLGK